MNLMIVPFLFGQPSNLPKMKKKLTLCTIPLMVLLFPGKVCSQSNLLNNPEGICYYSPWKAWFVSNAEGDNVVKIDSLGNQFLFWEGINIAMGIEAIGDSLYISSNEPYRITCLSIPDSSLVYELPTTGVFAVGHMDYDPRHGHLYIINQHGGLMRVNIHTRSYQIYVPEGTGLADGSQAVVADTTIDRLFVFSWPLAYVRSVSMTDSTDIINLFNPGISQFIASSTDADGNIYVSSWATNRVYKYPPHLQGEAVVFSANHDQPAGMAYNPEEEVLAICNFGNNTVDFVSIVTGIEDNTYPFVLEKASIYPNPATTSVILEYRLKVTADIEIEILDQAGRVRFSDSHNNKLPGKYQERFCLQALPQGMYHFIIRVNNQVAFVKKMIRISP